MNDELRIIRQALHFVIRHSTFALLLLGLALLSGCTALSAVEERTQRLIVPADQLATIREQIQAQPCGEDQRVTVLGVEDRTGSLHLVIGCVGR